MPTRILSKQELSENGYGDLADFCDIFQHDAVEMENGVWRWKTNELIDYIEDNSTGNINMNVLWLRVKTIEDILQIMKYYMQIGMSLAGFCEVFGQKSSVDFGLPDAIPINEEDEDSYGETLLEYVLKHFKGKIVRSL